MKKIYVTHNSCFNASYDLNIVKEGLKKKGYEIVDNCIIADEIIFSGCGSHKTWINDAINQIKEIVKEVKSKPIIITGCLALIAEDKVRNSIDYDKLIFQTYSNILNEYTKYDFNMIDNKYCQNQTLEFEDNSKFNKLRYRISNEKQKVLLSLKEIDERFGTNLAYIYKNTTKGFMFYHEDKPIEFIVISRGCPYKCSYCNIPKGRGAYTSVPLENIIDKVKLALSKGIKKIMLVGDEAGNYGLDLGNVDFVKLLDGIFEISEELKLGIRYIEPTPFLKYYEKINKFCKEGKIFFLYIPFQTGSMKVLRDMNRTYDITDICYKCKSLIETTDTVFYTNWMVGFPSETESDFQETVSLMKLIKFQINVVIPYSDMPGTKSSKFLSKVSQSLINERLNYLRNISTELKINKFKSEMMFLEEKLRKKILKDIEIVEKTQIQEIEDPIS